MAHGKVITVRADGAFGGAERLVIDGGICVPAMRQRCGLWGERREKCALGARVFVRSRDSRGEVFAASTEGGGCLLGAWFIRSVKRDNAEEQRARIAPELGRHGIGWPGCRGAGVAGRVGCQRADGPFEDAERLVIDGGICASHATTRLPFGGRCVFGVHREPEVFVWGSGDWWRPVWCSPVQFIPVSSSPLPSSPPGR